MVLTEDSIISAPYYIFKILYEGTEARRCTISRQTLTTLELAFPCSYARKAVLTIGRVETRETKSGESSSGSDGEVDLDVVDSAGVGWNAASSQDGECL